MNREIESLTSVMKKWDNISGCYSNMELGFEAHYWVPPQ